MFFNFFNVPAAFVPDLGLAGGCGWGVSDFLRAIVEGGKARPVAVGVTFSAFFCSAGGTGVTENSEIMGERGGGIALEFSTGSNFLDLTFPIPSNLVEKAKNTVSENAFLKSWAIIYYKESVISPSFTSDSRQIDPFSSIAGLIAVNIGMSFFMLISGYFSKKP